MNMKTTMTTGAMVAGIKWAEGRVGWLRNEREYWSRMKALATVVMKEVHGRLRL